MAKQNVEDIYPLSPLQEGFLYDHELDPSSAIYWNQLTCRIRGEVSNASFRRAWQLIVDRHAVLRTRFVRDRQGRAFQIVDIDAAVQSRYEDLSDSSIAQQKDVLAAYEIADRHPPPLDTCPLMRLALFKLGEHEHCVFWSYHHIILDGWSEAVLWSEFLAAHHDLVSSRPVSLPPVEPYSKYIAWLARQELETKERFWKDYLHGYLPPIRIASQLEKPGKTQHSELTRELSTERSDAIRQLAARHRLTLNTLIQGAWALVLSAESGSSDVVFGTTLADRAPDLAGAESIVGLLLATVPVRYQTDSSKPIVQWLHDAQDAASEMMGYTGLSLSDIKSAAGMAADAPVFDVLYGFDNNADSEQPAGSRDDYAIEIHEVERFGRTGYPFSIVALPTPNIRFATSFDTATVSEHWCTRALDRLDCILGRICEQPEIAVNQLNWLTDEELDLLSAQDLATKSNVPDRLTVDQWFADHVGEYATKPAVVFGSDTLTYDDLQNRIDIIARSLVDRGVQDGDSVGLFMERSADLVPCILAIWRVGAVYVPLDSSHPIERLTPIAIDARIVLLLTTSKLSGTAAAIGDIVNVDRLPEAASNAVSRQGSSKPSSSACIFYSSGAEATPTGVPIRHESLVNLFGSLQLEPGMVANDRLLAVAPITADISLVELLLPMVTGATVCIASDAVFRDADLLSHVLTDEQVSVLIATPAIWERLLMTQWPGHSQLKALCRGDPLRSDLADQLSTRVAEVWNLYGQPATAVCSTAGRARAGEAINIGRAIANTTVRVVDRQHRVLPYRVPGALCLAGVGMSSGDLDSEPIASSRLVTIVNERTRQKFFRTDELVTMRADGSLLHHGRVDNQIIIRGVRIDPAEVEVRLNGLPGIAAACVTARTGDSGDVHLVAHYVPHEVAYSGTEIDRIGDRLAAQLPPHMVPTHFIAVPELPITRDGMIDQTILPDPVADEPGKSPQSLSLIEQQVANLWSKLLGPGALHRDDDFVQLGGHSLLLARLRTQLLEEFGCELSMAELYANTSIEAQARLVDSSQGQDEANVITVGRATDRRRFPLSAAQRRLWFLEQIEPSSGVFNIAGAYRLVGDLDVARLENAFIQVAARHEILRTRIVIDGGEPFQEVLAEPPVDWSVETAPAVHELGLRMSELASHVFDLAGNPPWLVRLFPIDGQHVLFMNFHHTILDGESVPVLFRELSIYYQNEPASAGIPDLPIQYGDFASWQQQQLEAGAYDSELAYWQAELAGELPTLRFPSFVERPPAQRFAGDAISMTLGGELVEQLREFAGSRSISLFNLLVAGFSAVLMRYCRQSELMVGSPAGALRHSIAAEQSLGPYLNTLAFRFHSKAGWTFDEFLEHVVNKVNAALCHQEIPFEQVVAALRLARDPSRTPVFQAMFAYRLGTEDRWNLPSIRVMPESFDVKTARTDLSCWVVDDDDTISLELEYASDLFDKQVTTAFLAQFEQFLRQIISAGQQDWMTIQLLRQPEFQRVVSDWNQTEKATPNCTIGDLIWERAREFPDRIAASSRDGQITYRQLQEQSRRVAASLTASGVGAGDFVGLAVTRSERLVVVILGILEAGAAYVPLDPDLPPDRLQFVLGDANIGFVVSNTFAEADLARYSCSLLDLDDLSGPYETSGDSPCEARSAHTGPAYLIYTSGSTGVPKGVEVGHSQVVNLLTALEKPLYMVQQDVLAAVTTTSFDISILELLLPLVVGARVYVVSESVTVDGALLAEEFRRSGASIVQATPATWSMLLDAGWQGDPNLRILCGGEALPLELARALRPRCMHLWNMYGPTETTVWSTCQQIDDEPGHVSIGKPIANTCVYILDEKRSPLPIGVEGEIYIAGHGVAQGYRGRDNLTEQYFMSDPFSAHRDQRMYRTGDLGRWRPDGTLEHLGRIDTQLKLRGYRIEAGDVESHLLTAPGVSRAAVAIRTGAAGDERLVAFVVLEQAMMLDAMELRRHLRERVPLYMIPQHFIGLDSLPLTENRKVDYKQLPQLTIVEAGAQVENELPKSANEKLVARIWSELLGVENISCADNFFELGGHSLLTIQVIVRLLEQTSIELAPQHFFNNSLSGIAA